MSFIFSSYVTDVVIGCCLLNRASGSKKKLNAAIQFPEVLDMSEYVRRPGMR